MSSYGFEAVSLIPQAGFCPLHHSSTAAAGRTLFQLLQHALFITWDAFPTEPVPEILWSLGAFMKMADPSSEYSLPLLLNI